MEKKQRENLIIAGSAAFLAACLIAGASIANAPEPQGAAGGVIRSVIAGPPSRCHWTGPAFANPCNPPRVKIPVVGPIPGPVTRQPVGRR